MLRTVLGGAVVAVLAAVLAMTGGTFGITTLWPLVLAVAIGLAAGPRLVTRTAAAAIGVVVGFGAAAVQIGVLPATAASLAITVATAVLILTAVAALSAGHLPLWAGLAGFAAFTGVYEPVGAVSPTSFLTDAPLALVTVLLALGLGAAIASAVGLAATSSAVSRGEGGTDERRLDAAEVV